MIRFATPADTAAVKDIWHKCFGDGEPFLSWNFERNYNPGDTLVWIEDGEVVATLQMQTKAINLYGEVVAGNYVFGIATLPPWRSRGIAAALLERSFEVAVKRGHVVSLLIPFNYKFYERFGYKLAYKLVKASIKKEFAPKLELSHNIKFADVDEKTIANFQYIYRKLCEPLNGWIARSDHEFSLILENCVNCGGNLIVCVNESGECVGYAIGEFEDGKFSAHEMAYVSDVARDSLLAGIFAEFPNCVEIEATTPMFYCDDLISFGGYLDGSKIYPFSMVKILNEAKFRQICGENEFFRENFNYANLLFS